ncbi:hypothetical protein N657DRAFT_481316 [Parathielavia appendiculata]|uniref:Uncharacterized protein n=1 Tax=Parathielavia appendiculata TaxID=2587402 RepID=A0AAN6Z260_9PEZI|nr:hypothetical protein N657DRAFT_481316 [Parathielavia appendiculata]
MDLSPLGVPPFSIHTLERHTALSSAIKPINSAKLSTISEPYSSAYLLVVPCHRKQSAKKPFKGGGGREHRKHCHVVFPCSHCVRKPNYIPGDSENSCPSPCPRPWPMPLRITIIPCPQTKAITARIQLPGTAFHHYHSRDCVTLGVLAPVRSPGPKPHSGFHRPPRLASPSSCHQSLVHTLARRIGTWSAGLGLVDRDRVLGSKRLFTWRRDGCKWGSEALSQRVRWLNHESIRLTRQAPFPGTGRM